MALLCATALLLPLGYVLAAAVPLLLVWVAECVSGRRWPWERTPADRLLALWVLVVAATGALSPNPDLAVPNAALLALGPVCGLAPALRALRERPGLLPPVCAAWVVGGVLAGAWVAWRFLHTEAGRGDLPQLGYNAAGTVLAASSLLAVGLAASVGPWWRPAVVAAQLAVLAGLASTLSRGAWLGWCAGVLCFAWLSGRAARRAALGLLVSALVAAAVYPPARDRALSALDPARNQDRVLLWAASVRMWADHPWTGVGFGAFVRAYPKYRLPGDPNAAPPFAHNLPLSLAVETGAFGLVAFLVFLGRVLHVGLRAALRPPPGWATLLPAVYSALVAVLAQQLVDGTLQSFHLGIGFWLLAAVLLSRSGIREVPPA